MYITLKAEINIKPVEMSLDEIAEPFYDFDYVDSPEIESDNVFVRVDNDIEIEDLSSLLDLFYPVIDSVMSEKMTCSGKIYDINTDKYLNFEVDNKGNSLRYRTTDWYLDEDLDDNESFDEYEEEGYHYDIDEDEFNEYSSKQKNKRRKINTNSGFGHWEYIDKE